MSATAEDEVVVVGVRAEEGALGWGSEAGVLLKRRS